MLKKLIRLHISDLWLCLGVVAGLFLIVNGIIAAVLLLSEGTSSVPLPSGVALPIAVGIMTLAVTVSHVSISFVQALQFGQSRRRALGLMLSLVLLEGGCSMALAAALMWAVYSILVKKYTERYDNFLVTRRVFLWAFLTSLPLVLLTDGLPSLTPLFTQPNILISWLFLGVFGNAVCFAIWNIAFKRLGVVVTNNYLYASPFVTVVVGWLLLDEKISWMSILGAVLITLGVIFANKSTEQ